ncbi:MAG: inorganic phosphate transporter [Chitinophagaceae bacterium]|nr:inorganic phosphate transporter [Chitinophagaceae bacterium]
MTFVIVVIILALIFDYINGFHDAANSIATIVSTKVLTPFQAVVWAAFFNFIAYLIFKDHAVANTIGKTVYKEFITLPVIFSGLVAAITWNLLTWWWGIPSSSSHTLIGGFAGAAIAHAFFSAWDKGESLPALKTIIDSSKIGKTVMFIFLAPLIGMLISMFFTLVTISRNIWIKTGILAACIVAIWFSFQRFETSKIGENVSKYFKVDKYSHEVEKLTLEIDQLKKSNGSIEKIQELEKKLSDQSGKLVVAEKNVNLAKPYLSSYESKGSEFVAKAIVAHVDTKPVEISKLQDKLALYLEVDRKKAVKDKGPNKLLAYQAAQSALDTLKPMAKKLHEVGFEALSSKMAQKLMDMNYPLGVDKVDKFKESIKVNVESDLKKEIAKADNLILRISMMAILFMFILAFIYNEKLRQPSAARTGNMFKKLQLLSSAAFSVGHGGNDAQKVMGIIAAALMANGEIADIKQMPDWVPLACYLAIGLGTLSGGWKIVKTMGTKITKVSPLEGVCAETAGAGTLFLTEQMGIPVSTTHTITGAIIGVGATKRLSAVRWGVTVNLLWAWILTIPISAILAAIAYWVTSLFMK